jgi:hypothetical protein
MSLLQLNNTYGLRVSMTLKRRNVMMVVKGLAITRVYLTLTYTLNQDVLVPSLANRALHCTAHLTFP